MKNLLILNRGEIAYRILKTAQKMGYKTFVPYMKYDKDTFAVANADVAIELEGDRVDQGYTNQDQILKVIEENNIEIVHPGYGFLSENHSFRKKLEDKGVAFAGPNAESMRLLGDKIEARKLAISLDVPVLQGSPGALESFEECAEFANKIGFPVMIKAKGGGGGIGMHKVLKEKKLEEKMKK